MKLGFTAGIELDETLRERAPDAEDILDTFQHFNNNEDHESDDRLQGYSNQNRGRRAQLQ